MAEETEPLVSPTESEASIVPPCACQNARCAGHIHRSSCDGVGTHGMVPSFNPGAQPLLVCSSCYNSAVASGEMVGVSVVPPEPEQPPEQPLT